MGMKVVLQPWLNMHACMWQISARTGKKNAPEQVPTDAAVAATAATAAPSATAAAATATAAAPTAVPVPPGEETSSLPVDQCNTTTMRLSVGDVLLRESQVMHWARMPTLLMCTADADADAYALRWSCPTLTMPKLNLS